ncbi:MAG: 30S ribosomal protein S6 [Clostridia bacterium]|nr:30S ribosomal protein S6 [Clostridia bacterium]
MTEVQNAYETVLVISAKLGDDDILSLVQKFKELIEKNAKLSKVDEWGKRKLAYEINKESEGYYILFEFVSSPSFPAELDRNYKITDGILRSIIVKK